MVFKSFFYRCAKSECRVSHKQSKITKWRKPPSKQIIKVYNFNLIFKNQLLFNLDQDVTMCMIAATRKTKFT